MYLPLSKFESIQRLGECTLHWHYVATTIYYVMVWVIIISKLNARIKLLQLCFNFSTWEGCLDTVVCNISIPNIVAVAWSIILDGFPVKRKTCARNNARRHRAFERLSYIVLCRHPTQWGVHMVNMAAALPILSLRARSPP